MKTSEFLNEIRKRRGDREIEVMVCGYKHKIVGVKNVYCNYLDGETPDGLITAIEIDENGIKQHVLEGAWQNIEDHFRHAQRIREELYRLEEAKEKIEDIKQVCPEIGIALTVAGKNIDKRIDDCRSIIDSERSK